MLGLKFCVGKSPSFKILKNSFSEAVRKISWKIHFLLNPSKGKDSDFLIKCKKDFRALTGKVGMKCPLTDELFNVTALYDKCCRQFSSYKFLDSEFFLNLIRNFKQFCSDNQIMIIEADKNAGICLVNKKDYDEEVMRQLNDLNTYHPSTDSAFSLAMINYKDKVNCFSKKLPDAYNLKYLCFEQDRPANFYILPKIHKKWEKFPKGRPISSTFRKNNKYVSRLLEVALKPCLFEINDLLIDTQHFLLLLESVNLDPSRHYCLATIDVEALYPSLQLSDCKKHCSDSYLRNKHINNLFDFNKQDIIDLLVLSLDFSYVAYEGNMYYQYKGIEMGNAASVSVANITVFHEVKDIFNRQEFVFCKRFLDDIFIIIDKTDIVDIDTWLKNIVQHRYLKFTFEVDNLCVNFLDVKVSLKKGNILCTELYKKPVSKHLYLHARSDHPTHLKNSLFYSQGLRVIRLCSEDSTRTKHLLELYEKFADRGYDISLLNATLLNLKSQSRSTTLKPKKELLISYLFRQNPTILVKYNIIYDSMQLMHENNDSNSNVYLVFPFYKCIKSYQQKVKTLIMSNLDENCTPDFKLLLEKIALNVVFSRTKNLKEILK